MGNRRRQAQGQRAVRLAAKRNVQPVLTPEAYQAWRAAQEAARLAKYAEIDAARAAKAPRGNPAK